MIQFKLFFSVLVCKSNGIEPVVIIRDYLCVLKQSGKKKDYFNSKIN